MGNGEFIHPRVVSASAELLYEDARHFQDDLDRFASHIFSFAVGGTEGPNPSDHFGRAVAVFGDWGSGKSTALGYLCKKVRDLTNAAQLADAGESPHQRNAASASSTESLPNGSEDAVVFQELDARDWEAYGDPRHALAYSLLVGAGEMRIDSITQFSRDFQQESPVSSTGEVHQLARVFFEGIQTVAVWPLAESWARDRVRTALMASQAPAGAGSSNPGHRRVVVLLIENVDRCSYDFVSGLLAAMDAWLRDDRMPVFFVIASSRHHVLESLRKFPLGRVSPEETLEKYIHSEIHVPSLLSDSAQVAKYLGRIIDASGGSRSGVSRDHGPTGSMSTLSAVIQAAGMPRGEPWSSVLFPLVVNESREITPRRAVDRLNKLLGTITVAADAVSGVDADRARRAFKIDVLRAFWPDFYHDVVRPLELASKEGERVKKMRAAMRRVCEIGSVIEYMRAGHEYEGGDALQAMLDSLTSQLGLREGLIDTRLARYLAMDPPWPPPAPLSDTQRGPTPPSDDSLFDEYLRSPRPADGGDSDLPALPMRRSSYPDEPAGPSKSDERQDAYMNFTRSYLRLNAAIDGGDTEKALRALEELVELVKRNPDAGYEASQVGNAALRAERLKEFESALVLHLAANRIEPDHANVIQNLVDFLLDPDNFEGPLAKDVPEDARLTRAESLLEDLATKHSDHKPWRTAQFRARLAALKEEEASGSDIDAVLKHFDLEPSFGRFVPLVALYADGLLQEHDFLQAGRALCSHDPASVVQVLRLIADQLVSEDGKERVAADIYLMLFERGVDSDGRNPDFLHDTWNNLAYALRGAGFPNAGLRCMVALHLKYRDSSETRTRLARMLSAEDQPDLAVSVFDGKIPEPDTFAGLPAPEDIQTPLTQPPEWWWSIELPTKSGINPIFREMK